MAGTDLAPVLNVIPIGDDAMEAVEVGEKRWASIKRICDSFGIASFTQDRKLENSPWATTIIMMVVAQDGRQRRVKMIDEDSLPLWLATIHASKVKPELRPKLLKYQLEAKAVLAAWFLGKRAPQPSAVPKMMDENHIKGIVAEAVASALALFGTREIAVPSATTSSDLVTIARAEEVIAKAAAFDTLAGMEGTWTIRRMATFLTMCETEFIDMLVRWGWAGRRACGSPAIFNKAKHNKWMALKMVIQADGSLKAIDQAVLTQKGAMEATKRYHEEVRFGNYARQLPLRDRDGNPFLALESSNSPKRRK